jgi:hypothetical protein
MSSDGKIYTFRSGPCGSGDTMVAVAPMAHVIAAFGDGGLFGEGGLSTTFNHVAIFRGTDSDDVYFGVWGPRRSSRFKAALEARFGLESVAQAPPARLTYWTASDMRTLRRAQRRGLCPTIALTAENRP